MVFSYIVPKLQWKVAVLALILMLALNSSFADAQWTGCLVRTTDAGNTIYILRWLFEGASNETLHMRVEVRAKTSGTLRWSGVGFHDGPYTGVDGAMIGSDFVVARLGTLWTYHRPDGSGQNGRPDPDNNAQGVVQVNSIVGQNTSNLIYEFRKNTAPTAGTDGQNGVNFRGQQTILMAWRNSTADFDFHDGGFCYFTIDWTKTHDPSTCQPVGYSIISCAMPGGSTLPATYDPSATLPPTTAPPVVTTTAVATTTPIATTNSATSTATPSPTATTPVGTATTPVGTTTNPATGTTSTAPVSTAPVTSSASSSATPTVVPPTTAPPTGTSTNTQSSSATPSPSQSATPSSSPTSSSSTPSSSTTPPPSATKAKKDNMTLYIVIAGTAALVLALIFVMVTVIVLKGDVLCTGGAEKGGDYNLML